MSISSGYKSLEKIKKNETNTTKSMLSSKNAFSQY